MRVRGTGRQVHEQFLHGRKSTAETANTTRKPPTARPSSPCRRAVMAHCARRSKWIPTRNPASIVKKEEVTRNAAGTPVSLTGCAKLLFPPTISVKPDTTNASSSSGLTVGVHVPQTAAQNPEGLAESSLRDATVALPAGVALNPSGADGLEACSEGLAGFEIGRGVDGSGFEEFNQASEPGVHDADVHADADRRSAAGRELVSGWVEGREVKIRARCCPKVRTEGSVYLAVAGSEPVREPCRDVHDGRRPDLGQHGQADRRSAALRRSGAGDRRCVLPGSGADHHDVQEHPGPPV